MSYHLIFIILCLISGETLAGNTSQAEKMIVVKDTNNIEGTTTKVDFFKELEQLGLPSWM